MPLGAPARRGGVTGNRGLVDGTGSEVHNLGGRFMSDAVLPSARILRGGVGGACSETLTKVHGGDRLKHYRPNREETLITPCRPDAGPA